MYVRIYVAACYNCGILYICIMVQGNNIENELTFKCSFV